MDIKEAYDEWSGQYDTNNNKTRDLEAEALKMTLADTPFDSCLEVGCGTGKNTRWLLTKAKQITAVDLSEKMLAKAREKINSPNVKFINADITKEWTFTDKKFNIIIFSLVLEHIEKLDNIFQEASKILLPRGYVYIGELHPFKQYAGTKARFENDKGVQILNCYDHHISDFIRASKKNGFNLLDFNEHFDDNDKKSVPRILTLLLQR